MGLFSKVGNWFNDLTGSTSAAKLQNKYQKEFAQNAHQWEVADLKKAGLNPVLSAGGSGASAGGAGGTTGGSGVNPIDVSMNMINTISSAKKLNADSLLADAQTLNTNVQSQIGMLDLMIKNGTAPAEIKKKFAELEQMIAQTNKINAEIPGIKASAEKTREETKRIRSGKLGEIGGTWVNDVQEKINKLIEEYEKTKDPKKLNEVLKHMGLKWFN